MTNIYNNIHNNIYRDIYSYEKNNYARSSHKSIFQKAVKQFMITKYYNYDFSIQRSKTDL